MNGIFQPKNSIQLSQSILIKGNPGPSSTVAKDFVIGNYVADLNISAGQFVAISRLSGRLVLADAGSYQTSFCIGFSPLQINAGAAGDIYSGALNLSDWTQIAGAPVLSVGQTYFLGLNGGITAVSPASIGLATSTVVGRAMSPSELFVNIANPLTL